MLGRVRVIAPLLLLPLWATPARADNPKEMVIAEALFDEGTRLFATGDYAAACPKFAESLRIDPGIGTTMWLADCYGRIHRTASAWALFREAAAMAEKQSDGRAVLARKKAAEIEPTLAKLVISISLPAAAGLVVKRDDARVDGAVFDADVPLDPGEHTISATAPGKEPWSVKLVVPAATRTVVAIPVLTNAAPSKSREAPPGGSKEQPSAPAADPGATQRLLGLGLGGVGVVFFGVGTIFGLSAKGSLDRSNEEGCSGGVCPDERSQQRRVDAKHAATISTVTFGVGLAALAGGAVLYFTAPQQTPMARAGLRVMPSVGGASGASGVLVVGRF